MHPPIRMLFENLQLISGSGPWMPLRVTAFVLLVWLMTHPWISSSVGARAARLEIDRLIRDRGIDDAIGNDDLLE